MNSIILPAAACFLASSLAAPLVVRYLSNAGITDVPNSRSSHEVPTPRGGGIASVVGVTAAAGLTLSGPIRTEVFLLLALPLAWAVIGFVDDTRGLPAVTRLTGQVATGALLGYATHGLAGAIFGTVLACTVVNTVNFMDGINGITSLTTMAWSLTVLIIGYRADSQILTVLAAMALAAAAAFLPWNAPRARLFLGDTGSYFFGGLITATILAAPSIDTVLLALTPLTLYFADVGFTLARRYAAGSSLLEAHREHVYQQLTNPGPLTHVQASILVSGLSMVISLSWLFTPIALATLLTAAATILYLWLPGLLTGQPTTRTHERRARDR